MKTNRLLGIIFLLGMVSNMHAQSGAACTDAIPLGKDYKAEISGPRTVWYTAWTFDLPLAVYFTPQNENDPAPEVEMDFSCTSGVYKDSIICSLFCKDNPGAIEFDMPYRPPLETATVDGKLVYFIKMGKGYRNLLLSSGISYNVEVFVKVTYKSKGTISIAPDDMFFSSCMSGTEFLQFGDTIKVKANDKDRHVVVPYVQWQYDSIYYKWLGESNLKLTVGSLCDYDPTDDELGADENILQIKQIKSKDSLKVSSSELKNYVAKSENGSGMFYAKFYSSKDGLLTVNRVPQAPPRGGATVLKYNQRVVLKANDTTALYAIPMSWDTATIFTTPTDHVFRMYIGTDPDFFLKDAIASYQFLASEKGHWLGLLEEEMLALWKHTNEQYLYVRFECSVRTSLIASEWGPSDCATKPLLNRGENKLTVDRYSAGAKFYRFYYNDWRQGTMVFTWNNNTKACDAYIGDTCDFKPKNTDVHVVATHSIPKRGGTWEITPDVLEQWADRVDPDGYLYVLIYADINQKSEMIISTDAPEETDPVYPHTTIKVVCADESGKNITVSVSEAQHVTLSGDGGVVEEWDAVPGETKTLSLESGSYVLQGENEKLTIFVP